MPTVNTTDPKPGYVYDAGDDTWYPLAGIATQTLDGLTDVVISSAASGQTLIYNGTNWVNIPPGNVGSQLVNCNGTPSWFCTPSVLTLPVSNITSNGASCSGIVTTDGGLPVSSRGVVYGTTMNPTLLDSVTNNGTGIGTFSSTLTG